MKIELVDKGDGWLLVRYEAQGSIEGITLNSVALGPALDKGNVSLNSYGGAKQGEGSVLFHSFSAPVHAMLKPKP